MRITSGKRFAIFSLCLLLSLSLSACSLLGSHEPTPESVSPSASPSLTSASESESAAPAAEPSQTAEATATAPTFAPLGTGSDPDPESPFAKLSADEQDQLNQWLSKAQTAFSEIEKAFADLAGSGEDLQKALQDGQSVKDTAAFQTFEQAVRPALQSLQELSDEKLSESAASLKTTLQGVASWTEDFLTGMGTQTADVGKWLEEKIDGAYTALQAFLDALAAFRS